MSRGLGIGLIVAAAFGFTIVAMILADPAHVPADIGRFFGLLMSPGMLIAFCLLRARILGPAFVLLSVALNMLIYSAMFWLGFRIFRAIASRRSK
jgi:hypothetical protein